jgi:histidine triad (HIT) family protein
MADDCIFCKIIKGDIPSDKIYEDDELFAFRDIAPLAPVHILLIPKRHIASLAEAGEEHLALLGKMQLVAAKLARKEGISESGYRTVINTNPEGGQIVFHLHLHLLGGEKLAEFA